MRCVKQERLYRGTDLVFSTTKDIDFGPVAPHPTLQKHILGVRVIVSGSMTQAAATAALPKERMWGVVDTISISAPGLNFQKGILTGEDLFLMGHAAGFYTTQVDGAGVANVRVSDIIVAADFANDQNPHTFVQSYVYPFAHGYYKGIPLDSDAAIQGCQPSRCFGTAGNVNFSMVADGGTMGVWDLTANTYFTVEVIADVLLTDETFLPGIPLMEATTTSELLIKSTEVDKSAFHVGLVTDDCYDAFTLATADCDAYCDDTQLFSGRTGQALMNDANQRRNAAQFESVQDLCDHNYTLIVDPFQCKTPMTSPSGKQVRSNNVGAQGGAVRVMFRRYVTPNPGEAALLLSAQGLPANIGPERLFYDNVPATLVGDRETQHGVTWNVR